MVKKLTKEAESVLLNALSEISDITLSGTDPNEAIAKVASEHKVPHGHIQLLVNAYNTGRTTAQRKSSDDVWSKAAEFPLADTAQILEQMYPEKIKTAAQLYSDIAVSDDYDKSPHWIRDLYHEEKKAEHIDWKMVDKPAPLPREDHSFRDAKLANDKNWQEVEEIRRKADYAYQLGIQSELELLDYFKTAGCVPFNEVKENAILMYGEPAKILFGDLAAANPLFNKQASKSVPSPTTERVYGLVADCMEAADAFSDLHAYYRFKVANAEKQKEELFRPFAPKPKLDPILKVEVPSTSPETSLSKEAAKAPGGPKGGGGKGGGRRPPQPPGFLDTIGRSIAHPWKAVFGQDLPKEPKEDPTKEKEVNPPGYIKPFAWTDSFFRGLGQPAPPPPIQNPLGKYFSTGYTKSPEGKWTIDPSQKIMQSVQEDAMKDQIKDYYKKLQEPEIPYDYTSQFDQMNQQSMLSDIMANDEVLRGHNPQAVLQAYSRLRELAPRASGNRELLTTLLREKMEKGQPGAFDLKNYIDIEKGMKTLERKDDNGKDDDEDK